MIISLTFDVYFKYRTIQIVCNFKLLFDHLSFNNSIPKKYMIAIDIYCILMLLLKCTYL